MPKLAIVTPSYNRANLLPRLYNSLRKQTNFSFKWYIVDDGSSDNTNEVCGAFETDKFEIVYLKKINGGKHTALNFAYDYISEELTIIIDSDDWLLSDGVATILTDWKEYFDDENIGSLSYCKCNTEGHVVGDSFKKNYYLSDHIHYIINERVKGDKAEVFKTLALRTHPFPVVAGERFLSEAVSWVSIALEYKTVYINKAFYCCEYLNDGLTSLGRRNLINNPRGYIEHAKAYMSKGVKQSIQMKYMLMYIAASNLAGLSVLEMFRTCPRRGKFAICFPAGFMLYFYWSQKYKS